MEPNLRPGEDLQHFLERQASEMRERATALQEKFSESSATVTSRDGAVTVTIAPNGALRNIKLGHRACELGPARLTSAIMDTVSQAQARTAHSVASSVASVMGGGETLDLIKSFLPTEPTASNDDVDQHKFVEEPETQQAAPPPKPPVTPPPRPSPRSRPPRDDAEDEVDPW